MIRKKKEKKRNPIQKFIDAELMLLTKRWFETTVFERA